ncbi:hypothetical protein IMZ38_03085 [Thermosphaera chiliense]|uniref:Uncharacterized protein n=1 Tax=Thermosphaera chiliense TaxID=3402707 RepID=A0A7M1URL4_9CREN|nr:hypothetical protein [Thermosphaera aggregans]QOR94908.1 hypothetical protein IMZ38_03085 [Thermosphaera aggregans]
MKPETQSIILFLLGILLIGLGVALALVQLYTYVPRIVSGGPEEALSGILYELLGLVAKLGFIGLVIYGGSVLLRNGVHMLLELRRIEKGVPQRSESSKQG